MKESIHILYLDIILWVKTLHACSVELLWASFGENLN